MNFKLTLRFAVFCLILVSVFSLRPGYAQSVGREDANSANLEVSSSNSEGAAANPVSPDSTLAALPDAPQATQTQSPSQPVPSTSSTLNTGQQTKRILLIVPNFRAASVDAKLSPMTAGEKVKLVLQDSFDYSSFIYVGIVAGIGQSQNSYPEFHQGAAGYGRYYWHSFADSVGENAFTEFIVPQIAHQDPRYYTLGRGGFPKRLVYSVSRLVICRDNNANDTFNFSEVVGAGASAGISTLYYPSAYATWTKTGQKWLTQVGVDGIGNIAKEFWPDINAHLFNNRF
jgi:hypothetical protein